MISHGFFKCEVAPFEFHNDLLDQITTYLSVLIAPETNFDVVDRVILVHAMHHSICKNMNKVLTENKIFFLVYETFSFWTYNIFIKKH